MSQGTNSTTPYYGPDEPHALVLYERAELLSSFFDAIFFGVQTLVVLACFHYILKPSARSRMTYFNLTYVGVMYLLAALFLIGDITADIQAWVDNRNFPDGPLIWFWTVGIYQSVSKLNGSAMITQIILADGLLCYRAWMLWGRNFVLTVVLGTLYLTSVAAGIITFHLDSTPNNAGASNQLYWDAGTVWTSLSTAVNILVTLLIIVRLATQARNVKRALGPEHARKYISLAAMVVESAAPVAVLAIFVAVSGRVQSAPWTTVFEGIYGQMISIGPEPIILRLAMGCAWKEDMSEMAVEASIAETVAMYPQTSRVMAGQDTDA